MKENNNWLLHNVNSWSDSEIVFYQFESDPMFLLEQNCQVRIDSLLHGEIDFDMLTEQ